MTDFLRTILDLLGRLFGGTAPAAPTVEPQGVPVHVAGEPNWVAILRAAGMVRPEAWAQHIAGPARRYGINNQRRAAAFAATIAHESANGTRMVESLNYRVDALPRMFGPHRGMTPELAQRIGRLENDRAVVLRAADQQAIANTVYGGEWGRKNLGNTEPGDGWRYRGRGLIQLTGRDAYRRAAAATGLPLEEHPESAEVEAVAAEIAAWTWGAWKGCNPMADAENIEGWRRAINGGLNGLDDVRTRYARALAG